MSQINVTLVGAALSAALAVNDVKSIKTPGVRAEGDLNVAGHFAEARVRPESFKPAVHESLTGR